MKPTASPVTLHEHCHLSSFLFNLDLFKDTCISGQISEFQ